MKALKPTLREKKRYLLIRGDGNLKENILKATREFLGEYGMSKTALTFIKSEGNKIIISINREMLNQVRASLCIFPEKMEVVRVSGTLKGLRGK
ncbi:hypothetical protein J4474_03785 [Candidatus Pacearchaeota archaeon]|nr:hypothetical protein [Candidatus Pacearchaeota archaeon]